MALTYSTYSIIDNTPDKRCRKFIEKEHGAIMESCFDTDDNLGDALLIRDWLLEAGFEWGKDFWLKKHKEGE